MKKIGILLIIVLAVFGVYFLARYLFVSSSKINPPNSPTSTTLSEDQVQNAPLITVVAQGLSVPWDMVFLPDGSLLITERPGRIRVINPSGKLQEKPVKTLTNVKQTGESGLHGIALHPDFPTNHYLYLYYTYEETGNNTFNRVSRFTYENNTLTNEKIIVDKIPGASNHDGGRIRFGPDKFLYITTGDAQEPSLAQDTDSLAGKILRVTDTGEKAPDNPFGNKVYSYGHRNPQGITWNDKGTLYATEHGRSGIQSGLDELNKIEIGQNYGWPTIQGDEHQDGMITPLLHSGADTTWAPSSAAYLNGYIYFTGLRGQSLYKATVRADTIDLTSYFVKEFGRLRNVIAGPDGMLYMSTSNKDGRGIPKKGDDKIFRINPLKL